ncbi:MAG: DsbA family protein [Candidatus Kerfeldbacteria bacterium]
MEESPQEQKKSSWWKAIGLICAIFVILVAAYFGRMVYTTYNQIQEGEFDFNAASEGEVSAVSGQTTEVQDIDNAFVDNFADDPSVGPDDAAITIVAFEDFQCPYCQRAYANVNAMLARHPDNIRFVFRDFPLESAHPESLKAHEAGQCAHEQGQFWPYYDRLFQNPSALDITSLKQAAGDVGLNTAQFDNCLDRGDTTDEVKADFQDGLQAGVSGTPTFFFNGNRVSGVVTEDGFEEIITYLEERNN